jgi:hypothetical protein
VAIRAINYDRLYDTYLYIQIRHISGTTAVEETT